MNRPTLGMLRNSRLPALIGECAANINVLRAMTNEAQERLLIDPLAPDEGWWGGWVRMTFNATVTQKQAYITTPREVARLAGINVCNRPVAIRNGFYEYMEFGTGLRDVASCCNQKCRPIEAFERDTVPTLTELSATSFVHCFPTEDADIGQEVVIQGLDENGKTVTEMDPLTSRAILGEHVTLAYPFTSTVNKYSKITGILKSPTIGRVAYEQYESDSAVSTELSSMEPGETTAQYRRYFLSGLPSACFGGTAGTIQITSQAKLDLIPAMSDQDYLFIPCIPALIEELMSLRYGSMDSAGSSQKEKDHHASALRLLFGQLDHFLGKTKTSVSVSIFGSDPLIRQRT